MKINIVSKGLWEFATEKDEKEFYRDNTVEWNTVNYGILPFTCTDAISKEIGRMIGKEAEVIECPTEFEYGSYEELEE